MINTTRHAEIFHPSQLKNAPISIVGCGATGSRIFMSLIELGITNISVYDPDTVESHNIANQAFTSQDIGSPKVHALKRLYEEKTGEPAPETMHFVQAKVPLRYGVTPRVSGIVFLLTDTMSSRRKIMEVLSGTDNVSDIIETRMASTHGNIYCVNKFNEIHMKQWYASLIDDEDGETSACGASISVGSTASIIANLAVWQFINLITNPAAVDFQTDIYLRPLMVSQIKPNPEVIL